LRQENERLREEVEILKKAAVYFAKELKWSTPLSIQSESTITLDGFVQR
jgi:transposase-like protein